MNVFALKLAGVAALAVIAVFLCFHNRRVFLTRTGSMSAKDLRVMFISLFFMAVAALLGLWAALDLTPPEWQRVVYSGLPLVGLTCYGLEAFFITRFPTRWKKSPWFWMAALPPILGCVLVMLISWCERDKSQ
jgi:hypothetical protein